MAEMWLAGAEVVDTMKDLIAKYHPHLAICDDEIAVLFKEKGSESGGVKKLGQSGKAGPLLSLLSGGKKWTFLITLAADGWQELTAQQQVALLDHQLCALRAEEDAETKVIKFFVAPPDVEFYKGEIERHGMWRTSGAPPTANLVSELFGDVANATEAKKPSGKKKKAADAE